MQSKQFYYFLKDSNCKAYNMPAGVKQVWANQYGKGYVFPDGSYFVHYYSAIGVFTQTLTTGKTFNGWCSIAFGDNSRTLFAIGTLKYEVTT